MSVLTLYRKLDPDNPLRRWARAVRPARAVALAEPSIEPDLATVREAITAPSDDLITHLDALEALHRVNRKMRVPSETTPRFRREVAFWLLDNPPRGPIIEVGTFNGGMTAQLAYLATVTGRGCFGVDLEPHRLEKTKETCARFSLDAQVRLFCGQVGQFLEHHRDLERPDFVFLDTAHDYNTTLAELRALHGRSQIVPRALLLHDYSYRHAAQTSWFDDCAGKNPVAVDLACRDFFARDFLSPVAFKRVGGLAGDGTVTTPERPGSLHADYIDRGGSEGMMVTYPY